ERVGPQRTRRVRGSPGRGTERCVRAVGDLRDVAGVRPHGRTLPHEDHRQGAGGRGAVPWEPERRRHLHRGRDPRRHDPADRHSSDPRGDRGGPERASRGGEGSRRNAVRDDPDGRSPVRPERDRRSLDAGVGTCARGDHRRPYGDRQQHDLHRRLVVPSRRDDPCRHRDRVPGGLERWVAPVRPVGPRAPLDGDRIADGCALPTRGPSDGGHHRGRPADGGADDRAGGSMIAAEGVRGGGLSRRRRLKDRAFTIAMWACGVLAMLPLVFIAGYVIAKGIAALNTAFFTKTRSYPGDPHQGISEAFVGTFLVVGTATLFSVPLGLLAGIYLSEYGKGRLASAVRFVAEILLSTPSIVAGAFIYAVVVVTLGSFSA